MNLDSNHIQSALSNVKARMNNPCPERKGRNTMELEMPYNCVEPSEHAIQAISAYKKKNKGNDPSIVALCGPVGCGKSWDACALASHAVRNKGWIRFEDCSGIHTAEADRLDSLKRSTVLILDDYGARQTEGALARVFDLVNSRMHKKGVTIITTNLMKEIRKIDERLASRLNTACVINYAGMPDRRINN